MIFPVLVSIKEIVAKGRDFPWPRPEECHRCEGRRVWCHGFVSAYFDGFSEQVFLRRYRCPECRCVMRARPSGYFKRVQVSVETVRSSIAFRLEHGRWPPGSSRSRQCHIRYDGRARECSQPGLFALGSDPIFDFEADFHAAKGFMLR
jgi:hypothetical protein